MPAITAHDANDPDPLKRPYFSLKNKISRLIWNIVHALLFRPSPVPLHAWRCFLLRAFGAKLGKSNFIYPTSKVWAPWLLETEDVVTLGPDVEVYNPGGVYLGHHTILSQGAFLCGATHDYNRFTFDYITKPIRTEAYTWICAKAMVLPGVTAGEGSVLGAGAVIGKNMAPWTVYAGNPAKAVKERERFDVNQTA